jgi:UDP-2,3-diacylglucosamine pyrophosphatase LpxH
MWATRKFSSRPNRQRIFPALDKLYKDIRDEPAKKGIVIPFAEEAGKFIIFSDQHKGARNGADDFANAEPNYLAALEYYQHNDFYLICLGDSEELWENSLSQVKEHNVLTFDAEKKFVRNNKFVKIIGNHDLYWGNDPFAWWQLKNIYEEEVKIYEGVVLATSIGERSFYIFCTHGHQGDAQSDGNWFSKFFVARIWGPLQAWLRINPNTPAYNNEKKTLHNEIMYEWASRQQDTLLITGHTHQPVFESLTQIERLYRQLQGAQSQQNNASIADLETAIRRIERKFSSIAIDYLTMRPSYFNSGCCCYSDGDITGIEIEAGCIRLIKWETVEQQSQRVVLEEMKLSELVKRL